MRLVTHIKKLVDLNNSIFEREYNCDCVNKIWIWCTKCLRV